MDVLVVDDDPADTWLVSQILRAATLCVASEPRSGLSVLVVEDDEADAYLIRGLVDPDVSIIDLHLPRVSGFSLLVELGCRPNDKLQTIVLTSSTAMADAARSRLRGADCFLTKPDTIEELGEMLAGAIKTF